jgi:hypothetical protein
MLYFNRTFLILHTSFGSFHTRSGPEPRVLVLPALPPLDPSVVRELFVRREVVRITVVPRGELTAVVLELTETASSSCRRCGGAAGVDSFLCC